MHLRNAKHAAEHYIQFFNLFQLWSKVDASEEVRESNAMEASTGHGERADVTGSVSNNVICSRCSSDSLLRLLTPSHEDGSTDSEARRGTIALLPNCFVGAILREMNYRLSNPRSFDASVVAD